MSPVKPIPAPTPKRAELFGVPVDSLTMDETVEQVRRLVRSGGSHRHVAVNAAKIVEADRNPELRRAMSACDIVSADGMSIVWASRLLGRPLAERVPGIDLFQQLVAVAAADGDPVYFLGATEEVVGRVAVLFATRYPSLRIAGYHDGFWQEDAQMAEEVRRAAPTYLFLAVPSPRKEIWLEHYVPQIGIPFAMGVGGSFDVVAGVVSRAPGSLQRVGLEWAWRLAQEPRRMWKRYLVGNLRFAGLVAREWRRNGQ